MLLLDTSILIELFRKTNKENSTFYKISEQGNNYAISVLTKYEIKIGNKPEHLEYWDLLLQNFEILPFDSNVASEAAEIFKELKKSRKLIELIDLAIGATARYHNLKLVTLNRKHFERIIKLEILD